MNCCIIVKFIKPFLQSTLHRAERAAWRELHPTQELQGCAFHFSQVIELGTVNTISFGSHPKKKSKEGGV